MTENSTRSSPNSTQAHSQSSIYREGNLSIDSTYRYYNSNHQESDIDDGQNNDSDVIAVLNTQASSSLSVAEAIAQMLAKLGINYAFGVAGGAMASVWGALSNSSIQVIHCRHESGAAFAASEAYFATNEPVVVFTTAGPGLTNSLTGLFAARDEGAKVILISACTSAPQRGRWAIQETSSYTLPSGIFTSGTLFNFATTVETADQLPQIFRRLALGLSQSGGFVAHLSIPTGVQTSSLTATQLPRLDLSHSSVTPSEETIAKCVQLLSEGSFAIWLGFGARNAAKEIQELAEKTGAAVMCSPRGKGIFPEEHPQFVGVTGLGGHSSVITYMQEQPPLRTLVLGTRLGEPTSFWSQSMIPAGGYIHVDIDPKVPGVAYPHTATFPVQSDISMFLRALLKHLPQSDHQASKLELPRPEQEVIELSSNLVRPEAVMSAIQQIIVEGSDAVIMAECGNSFTWATHLLRINQANRYRVSTGVGSMGHMVTGVLGAALGRQGKAVAIVGDGAMLMNSEVSTAVKYQIPAVWVVLNDARYNMCQQGMAILGLKGADATIPQTNFVMLARGMGADGIQVDSECDLQVALAKAIASPLPFVVDVIIDSTRLAPSGARNQSLRAQGATSSSNNSHQEQVSFPAI